MEQKTPATAEKIFAKHWKKATGKPLDETTKVHMQYAIDAVEEALKYELPIMLRPEPTNKPEAPMTWENCLEKVSRELFEVSYSTARDRAPVSDLEQVFSRAAELYARSKCREQREICAKALEPHSPAISPPIEAVRNAPAPEFKA